MPKRKARAKSTKTSAKLAAVPSVNVEAGTAKEAPKLAKPLLTLEFAEPGQPHVRVRVYGLPREVRDPADGVPVDVGWDHEKGALIVSASQDAGPPGGLRGFTGEWFTGPFRAVEAWIDGQESGVRVHLADGRAVEVFFYDSGNCDFTATWNEYLHDGCWAFGAGRTLADWLEVPYFDAWVPLPPNAGS